MENAGQLIEDEELRAQIKGSGIGTSATRAEIIAKLIRIGYLNLNGKSQIITPENFGEMVYEVVNMTVPSLLNPKMTASWEKGLDGITQGSVIMADYRAKLEDYIRRETVHMRDTDITNPLASRISNFRGKGARGLGAKKTLECKCPVCGGDIVTTPFGYGCNNYKKDGTGCKFNIGQIAGRDLTEEECIELIRDGATPVLSGFVSKTKKKFQARLVMSKNEEGQVTINFDFSENKAATLDDVVCPDCGAPIEITGFGYRCSAFNPDDEHSCRFSVGKIADKEISQAFLKQLLNEKKTETIRGFKSKAGKKFDACLVLKKDENGKSQISFDFEDVEAKKIKDVVCPLCGGDIVQTPFGFGCANYRKDDESSCRFSIGKMAGRDIPETAIKDLLTNGRTSTLRGFKSKTGKKFDARIALNKDETGKVTGLKFDFDELEQPKLKDAKCPICGGDVTKTQFGYGCSNYNKDDPEKSCKFAIGKIGSMKLNDSQVRELLTNKKTGIISGFIAKSGKKFDAALKLNDEGQVVFDFPERPKPTDTSVMCPRCKERKLKKEQWYYTCECGFKIGHTVAKVPITEEVLKELFETGKTKKKITGFTSKAGNIFDTCLKYENEMISFDFDNPGESDSLNTPSGNLGADLEADGPVVTTTVIEDKVDNEDKTIEQKSEATGFEDMYAAMASEEIAMEEQMAAEQDLYEQSLGELPWN